MFMFSIKKISKILQFVTSATLDYYCLLLISAIAFGDTELPKYFSPDCIWSVTGSLLSVWLSWSLREGWSLASPMARFTACSTA